MSEEIFSPAKLNLFFRVLRKREDGYHEIASLFQAVDLGDTLFVERAVRDHMSCNDPFLLCDASNLVIKALETFRAKTGFSSPVAIHLNKKIPVRAGLGGGSSNAASMLWALNRLSRLDIPEQELRLWGAEIGSDVPFFFSSGTAYCTGRGEQVESLASLSQGRDSLWIAKPVEELETSSVYRHVDLSSCASIDPREALNAFANERPHYFNDLESSATLLQPRLKTLKEALTSSGFSVCMTGSGTSFFCFGKEGAIPPLIPSLIQPRLPGVTFFKVSFIQRTTAWYSAKKNSL